MLVIGIVFNTILELNRQLVELDTTIHTRLRIVQIVHYDMITEHIHREFFNINAWNAVNRKTMHSKRMFRTACTTLWGSVAFRSDMCLSSSNVLWRCSFLCWATEFFFLFEVLLSFDAFFTFFLAVGSILVQSDLISQAKTQQYQCKCIRSFCSNCGSSNVSHTHKKRTKKIIIIFSPTFVQCLR